MESYINDKKKLYDTILEFLENTNENSDESFENLTSNLNIQQIEGDPEEMSQFLQIIESISNNHHRDQHFIDKTNKILQHYKSQIKQTLSNIELFHLFKNNKILLLFLMKNDMVAISEPIYNEMVNIVEQNGNRYCHFFYPELESFAGEEKMANIKNELLAINPNIFDHFEENRQLGENESHICSLIRQDSVEEFISYINRNSYSVSSEIRPSILETNSFILENESTSLIEYSAFYGSIQIFQYLLMNNVELTQSLWFYSIHSKNAELIHLLESTEIQPPSNDYIQCLFESIKCHHNEFAEYIENNFLNLNKSDSEHIEEMIVSCYLKYHNYSGLKTDTIIDHGFFYLCFYNYNKLVYLLLLQKQDEIEDKIILNYFCFKSRYDFYIYLC